MVQISNTKSHQLMLLPVISAMHNQIMVYNITNQIVLQVKVIK